MTVKKALFKMNLQLFAGLFDPNNMPTMDNPLLSGDVPVEPALEPPVEPTEPIEPNIEVPNEPNTNEPTFDIKAYLDSFKNDLTNDITSKLAPPVEEPKGPTEEETAAQNEEFLSKFYENPMQSIQELAEKIASEKVAPIMQEREMERKAQSMNQMINEFKTNTPDFDEMLPEMIKIIQERPYLNNVDNPLIDAYKIAKADKLEQTLQSTPKSIEDFMQDPAAMEKLMQNEEIKNMFLQQHMKGINSNKPPQVIGSGSGQPVITPPNEPKSLKDGTKLFMQSLTQ